MDFCAQAFERVSGQCSVSPSPCLSRVDRAIGAPWIKDLQLGLGLPYSDTSPCLSSRVSPGCSPRLLGEVTGLRTSRHTAFRALHDQQGGSAVPTDPPALLGFPEFSFSSSVKWLIPNFVNG